METTTTFGNWLKKRRRILDLTQQGLADLVGCSLVTIRKFEAEERRPSKQLAELLAVHLQIPADEHPAFIAFARTDEPLADSAPPPAAQTLPPTNAPSSIPVHLPASLTSLIGRDEEITAVCQTLLNPAVRLLTLTGPAGTGKTRLSLEVAHTLAQNHSQQFLDGIYFVNLSAVSDPALLIPTIAEAIGLKDSGTQALQTSLHNFLRPKRLLLILDNFEQLLDAAEELLNLLKTAVGLRLLVTSRVVLHLYGEHEYSVPPLALPTETTLPETAELLHYPAISLFVERARAAKHNFALTAENALPIVQICTRLDGLPLAIELAAARSKLFAPPALLSQLTSQLDFLTNQNRYITERQRSVRGAIEWSYNLLPSHSQTLFARLGVFVGDFDLPAVLSLYAGASPAVSSQWVLDTLSTLVDHSMVQQAETAESAPRFRLLLTLRDYALEQLTRQGELQTVQAAHAHYYLQLAEQTLPHLTGPQQVTWFKQLEADHDNLRAALLWFHTHHHHHLLVQLATALAEFWRVRGYLTEGRQWLRGALAETAEIPPHLHIQALCAAGMLAYTQADYPQAHQHLEQALAFSHAQNDLAGQAQALLYLGRMAWSEEQYTQSLQLSQQALHIEQQLGNQTNIATLYNNMGLAAHYQGDNETAHQYFTDSLAIAQQIGHKATIASALNNIGNLYTEIGNYKLSRQHYEESLHIFQELGYKQNIAITLANLGSANLELGNLDLAEQNHRQSLEMRRQLGARIGETQPLHGLGVIARQRGHHAQALYYFEQSLIIWQEANRVRDIPSVLDGIAGVMADIRRPYEGVQLLGATEMIRQNYFATPQNPFEKQLYAETVASLHAQLSPEAFEAAWQVGRDRPLDAVILFARRIAHILDAPLEEQSGITNYQQSAISNPLSTVSYQQSAKNESLTAKS